MMLKISRLRSIFNKDLQILANLALNPTNFHASNSLWFNYQLSCSHKQ